MASFLISGGYLFRIHAWWWERHDLHPERIWVDENRSLVWCCHWMTRIWIHLLQRTFSHKNPSFLKDNWQGKYEYDEDYYYHHYYYDGDTVTAHLHASKSSNSQSLQNKKKNRNSVACPVGRLDLPPHFADHQFPHWWWPSESPMPCVEGSRVLNSQGRCRNNMGSEGQCKSPLKSVENVRGWNFTPCKE